MHKPLRIIKDDARVRLTQQVNLTSAVRAALLTLPTEFSEVELFERLTAISYTGDPRMILPAENRGKIGNIVRKQAPQFKELYHRLVIGLPGVHWPAHVSTIRQDTSPLARSAHLKKLPSNLLTGVTNHYTGHSNLRRELDESAYWVKLAEDAALPDVMRAGQYQPLLSCETALLSNYCLQKWAESFGTPLPSRPLKASSVPVLARVYTMPARRWASGGKARRTLSGHHGSHFRWVGT